VPAAGGYGANGSADGDTVPPGYTNDTAKSGTLTSYLQGHRLPLVGAQVLTDSSGDQQIILYGFVATEFGKQDAADKARRYLHNPDAPVINRIAVRPELASGANGSTAGASGGASGNSSADASGSSGNDLGSVQSYQDQEQQAQQQQQYMQNSQPSPSALSALMPLIGMMGMLSMGSGGFGMGGGSYAYPPSYYGSPFGGSPYGSPYSPYGSAPYGYGGSPYSPYGASPYAPSYGYPGTFP
jgi:hypothetical protein